jgi:hypothetical protein
MKIDEGLLVLAALDWRDAAVVSPVEINFGP